MCSQCREACEFFRSGQCPEIAKCNRAGAPEKCGTRDTLIRDRARRRVSAFARKEKPSR